jgi:hypothetical protein
VPIDPITASTALAPAPRSGTPPPDGMHKSTAAPTDTAESIHAAINGATHTATATASAMAAGASGAIEHVGPTLGKLASKAAGVVGSIARAAAPIAGAALGAAEFVLATTAPAGETEEQLAHARAIDAKLRGSTARPRRRRQPKTARTPMTHQTIGRRQATEAQMQAGPAPDGVRRSPERTVDDDLASRRTAKHRAYRASCSRGPHPNPHGPSYTAC